VGEEVHDALTGHARGGRGEVVWQSGDSAQDIGQGCGQGELWAGCGARARVNTQNTFRDIDRKAEGIHGSCVFREAENAGGVDEDQLLKAQSNQATLTSGYIEIDGGQEVTHNL